MNAAKRTLVCGLFFAITFIAGCAHKTSATGKNDAKNEAQTSSWAGRISLQVQVEPPQAFFAGFELKGHAGTGELTLTGPLGSILGIVRWTPLDATLEQGGNIKRFASTDELLTQTTGAAIPVSALFDWLSGKNVAVPGWVADLSQLGNGRISAQRTDPAPQASLRIVLDK